MIARGTRSGVAYELRWTLDGTVLELAMDVRPGIRVEEGGADFFDMQHLAFFNSLPVIRDGLLDEGAAAREQQRYEPLGNRAVRYSSDGYQANITFDADGFVTPLPGLSRTGSRRLRINARPGGAQVGRRGRPGR